MLFTRKKASSKKQANLGDMFQKASKSVCTSTIVMVPHDPSSPTPSTSLATRTPKNTEQEPDDLEPGYKGDIQIK
jgi:hypothetical protein